MKAPEFSLESLKKKNWNCEKLNAHYLLKIPIFIILVIFLILNAFIYLLIRFCILLFENISFFIIMKYKDFIRSINRNNIHKKYKNNETLYEKLNNCHKNYTDYHEKNQSIHKIEQLMNECNNYYDYLNYAYQMDVLTGKIIHINENDDYINAYDANMIKKTTESIKESLLNNNILSLLENIKIATSSHFKGIFQEKYYCKAYSTSNIIVTKFINYISIALDYLETYIQKKKEEDVIYIYSDEYILIKKYFKEIFNQWGFTALFLSGGAILGLHHFGVIETFLNTSINVNYFDQICRHESLNEIDLKKKEQNCNLNREMEKSDTLNDINKEVKNDTSKDLNKKEKNNISNNLNKDVKNDISNDLNKEVNNDISKYLNKEMKENYLNDFLLENYINKNINNYREKKCESKNIYDENIMPQIICGTSAGSIVAAWVCSRTKEEFLKEFNIDYIYKTIIFFSANNSIYSFFNIFKKGNLLDVEKFATHIYNLYGDITFLEAFLKTNLVLNITVTRAESGNNANYDEEGHIVLNYINSPNVLIYSAVLASCSFPYLLQPFKLLEKKYKNENTHRFMVIQNQLSNSKNINSDLNIKYNKNENDENNENYKNLILNEYKIINSIQFKNMYFHDGSLKCDIPIHILNQIFSVKYKIVSQVNPHIFPFTGLRIHGEAGKPIKWRGNYGHWRAGFLMSSMEILFKENIRYILRLMALLDLSPTIRGINAGSIAMQIYNGDVTLHPKRLFMKHFKLMSVSNYQDVEWYLQQGRQMTYQKLPLIISRMKIEKKLMKMKKILSCQL